MIRQLSSLCQMGVKCAKTSSKPLIQPAAVLCSTAIENYLVLHFVYLKISFTYFVTESVNSNRHFSFKNY